MKAIALVATNLTQTPLGLRSKLTYELGGLSVLQHTLARLSRCGTIKEIVLVHPAGQDPLALTGDNINGMPIAAFPYDAALDGDPHHTMRMAARRWSPSSWRGGLGATTCYDELLPANRLSLAAKHHGAQAVLLVGGDWMLVDPVLCDEVMARHLEFPDAMKMVFTQAPPGLAGIAMNVELLASLAENAAGLGQMLGYVPSRPQADPIGLDVCVQVLPQVRSSPCRFIFDTPRSVAMIKRVADQSRDLNSLDAQVTAERGTKAWRAIEREMLPREVTIELTPRRELHGRLTPQHYIAFDRSPMELPLARRLLEQIGDAGDVTVTLGGVGDALLHPQWETIVQAAHDAGAFSVHVETDLLVDEALLARLYDLPIDIVSVRLNADTAAMYERTMGSDRFSQVVQNLQWMLNERQQRLLGGDEPRPRAALPWIVPRLTKTDETLTDMETFFDRWMHFAGHALIEPARSGRGYHRDLSPAMSPVAMAPPKRVACRQLERRMTILADGRVALCDQDWLGDGAAGDASVTPLRDIWQAMNETRTAHDSGRWSQLALCGGCQEWHRP